LTLTLDQSSAADVHASHPSRVEKLTCVCWGVPQVTHTHTHTQQTFISSSTRTVDQNHSISKWLLLCN